VIKSLRRRSALGPRTAADADVLYSAELDALHPTADLDADKHRPYLQTRVRLRRPRAKWCDLGRPVRNEHTGPITEQIECYPETRVLSRGLHPVGTRVPRKIKLDAQGQAAA
jgi:hypothetical protein